MFSTHITKAATLAFLIPFVAFSCKEDTPTPADEGNGDFSVEMTDAPIDDADIKAVFVTVADVRVDGQSLEGFSTTTVEVSALTGGRTERLYDGQLAAETYNSVEIVLEDGLQAVAGGPGCYYINENNEKVALDVANEGIITVQQSSFEVTQNSTVAAVVDFDLRKALVRTDDETKPYRFAAADRLQKSIRFVEKDRTGTLSGTVTNDSDAQGEIVVYAYKQGTYSASEAEAESDSDLFLNAVSSTKLNANNEYTLAFLEAGVYELIAVNYDDTDQDGKVEMQGQFSVSAIGGLDLGLLNVTANSQTTVDFSISGFGN